MPIIKHEFVSSVADGSADLGLVRPSNWNSAHIISCSGPNMLLGCASVSASTVQEIPCTSVGRAIIGAATTGAAQTALGLSESRIFVLTAPLTTSAAANISVEAFSCNVSGSSIYAVEGTWHYTATSAGTSSPMGIGVAMSAPSNGENYTFAADIYGVAADGTDASWVGYASTNADPIIATSANAAGAGRTFPIEIRGIVLTTATAVSNIQFMVRSEVASAVGAILMPGSWVRVTKIGTR